ncbi:flavodoxin [Streptococcus cuniculi]|nr:flavodoxin [Streptococcus cuniculi]
MTYSDNRLCLGASAILKSVYFRAFAVNVKTIALGKYLYQFGHAIWYGCAPNVVNTFCKGYDWTGKKVVACATSGGSGIGKTADKLKPYVDGAVSVDVKIVHSDMEVKNFVEYIEV